MESIQAVVQNIIRSGRHGPYAVATSRQVAGSVTFSLEPTVWAEREWPEAGMVVLLEQMRLKRSGWRAKKGRFWKLSDEQVQHSERSRPMTQFLYPVARQFPFDEVCERIVREMESRNWQVPGLSVDFHEYGTGEAKYRCVSTIKSADFKLWFCRVQGRLGDGRYNNTAAITEIVIPQKEIHVHDDESGPTFYLYAGQNYAKDRDKFMNGGKVNSRLNREPRTYLKYRGGCNCVASGGASFEAVGLLTALVSRDSKKLAAMDHTHPGRRPPLLVHDNDLSREYEPEGKEPRVFKTKTVLDEFKRYLEEVVLPMITAVPIPVERVETLVVPTPIPWPESIGPLFSFAEWRDAGRISIGRANPAQLDPADRYGLIGNGWRLMSLGTKNDGTVPEIAYEGFLWCGLGPVTKDSKIKDLSIPGHISSSFGNDFLVRLTPNRANDIYIADHGAYERRRAEMIKELLNPQNRDRFTDEEVGDFVRARGRTIIPISDYRGDFEQPVVLINRELGFDEVEVVSGPHKD